MIIIGEIFIVWPQTLPSMIHDMNSCELEFRNGF